jgi:hypothetical protein
MHSSPSRYHRRSRSTLTVIEIHEDWIEAHRYLNMEMLREQRKQLQLLEAA